LPKVNVNFALCHEAYHVFCQKSDWLPKVEFANEYYGERDEEFAANLFAGMLLMPETGFRFMYRKFQEESAGNEIDTLIRLMHYYEAPYMAVLIRCCELELRGNDELSAELLNVTKDQVKERSVDLWLDGMVLEATKKDDYKELRRLVKYYGAECIQESYINERTLKKVLQNMQTLYHEIKGE
jgi:Zn-dependent peptidase ImmA (M78 family)